MNNKGFNLVELTVGMSISILVLLTFMGLFSYISKSDRQLNRKHGTIKIKVYFSQLFTDLNAVKATIYHTDNKTFECLQKGTSCEDQGGDQFIIYDRLGVQFSDINVNESTGFDIDGNPCSEQTGKKCHFKAKIEWKPVCSPTQCNNPIIRFHLNITESDSNLIKLDKPEYKHMFAVSLDNPIKDFIVATDARYFFMEDGTIFAAGSNRYGELGRNPASVPHSQTPIKTFGPGNRELEPQKSLIRHSTSHTCSITLEDEAYCWGNNMHGDIGNGTTSRDTEHAMKVSNSEGGGNLDNIAKLFTGTYSSNLAMTENGDWYAWGLNNNRFGISTPMAEVHRPQRADLIENLNVNFSKVVFGQRHACGLLTNKRVICWGAVRNGELGNGERYPAYETRLPDATRYVLSHLDPTQPLEGVVKLIPGHTRSTCAILEDRTAVCWGTNVSGTFGFCGGRADTPVLIPGLTQVRDLLIGSRHACAIAGPLQEVWCWGQNRNGVLGIGTNDDLIYPPQPVPALRGQSIKFLGLRNSVTCVITHSNQGYCWGRNNISQIQNTPSAPITSPVAIEIPN